MTPSLTETIGSEDESQRPPDYQASESQLRMNKPTFPGFIRQLPSVSDRPEQLGQRLRQQARDKILKDKRDRLSQRKSENGNAVMT